ncbi:MAG: ATP-dependent DNA helicase RecG [Minisyncoccia bacterium]|jgi:ATP-dependent DNA helicase RecG
MAPLALDSPLFEVVGARVPLLRQLEKLGVTTVGDLLYYFPFRYEDFSKIYAIADLEPGQQATIQATIEEISFRHTWKKRMSIVEAILADTSGSIRAVWFNQPYVANVLKVGRLANFAGKVSLSEEGEVYLSHPAYEVIRRPLGTASAADAEVVLDRQTKHTARLVPIYPETRGLTSRGIRFVMQSVLRRTPLLTEWIPPAILTEFRLPELGEAIASVHFPKHLDDALAAKKRFAFEDLFLLQLFNLQQKLTLSRERAPAIAADIPKVKRVLSALPFMLTASQKKSLWEIMQDMARPRPMNRLLQGDVGSGKTVVAAIAAMSAATNGFQTAFMAPTEILAHQHFETMKKLFDDTAEHGTAIGLLTASGGTVFYENGVEAKMPKPALHAKTALGEIAIVFGTHALIQKSVYFKNLGFVIVDEQHRFGVRQRAELSAKKGGLTPHFLSMSATPIPRTLMLTVFGDLDLSLITELPAGRKPIATKLVPPLERAAAYTFVRGEIKQGRQAFVICPRIEPAEVQAGQAGQAGQAAKTGERKQIKTLELKSVKEEYEKLSKNVFPDLAIATLHGQMKASEKDGVMRQFRDKQFDILVTTSVVEVGVDIPNATIMMIEGAERFGLAQLYQFRGRVGRGEHQSYCFLMADSNAKTAHARLKAILEAKNGFELAEKDLALRGPGQFFGEIQTGLPDVAMEALRDPELVKASRDAAIKTIQADPSLKTHPLLKTKLTKFRNRIHQE